MGASKEIRLQAGRRDKWRCTWDETLDGGTRCDRSFQTGWLIDLAHLCHDKSSVFYNSIEWLTSLCLFHHAEQHKRMNDGYDNLIEMRIRQTGGKHR